MCKPSSCCGTTGSGLTGTAVAIAVCAVIAAAIIRALLHLIEMIAVITACTLAAAMVIAGIWVIAEHWHYRRVIQSARQSVPGTDEWLTRATDTLVAEITQAHRQNAPDA
jgi:high-affinity Fe2+/Pb2+ permease